MLFQRRPLRCPAPCSLAMARRASRDDAFATAPFQDFMISSTLSHLQVQDTHPISPSLPRPVVERRSGFRQPPSPRNDARDNYRCVRGDGRAGREDSFHRLVLPRWAACEWPLATSPSATCNFPPHPRYDGRTDPAARISRDEGSSPFRPFGRRIVRLTSIYWSRQSDRRRHIRDYRPQCANQQPRLHRRRGAAAANDGAFRLFRTRRVPARARLQRRRRQREIALRGAVERSAGRESWRAARHDRARQGQAPSDRLRQWRRHGTRRTDLGARNHRQFRHARLPRQSGRRRK